MKKKFTIFILCLVCLMAFQTSLKAQLAHIRVSITVVDNQQNPMPGVTVMVLNGLYGGQTNADGQIILYCPPYCTLNFSFIGYMTQNVEVNGRTYIKVVMQEDNSAYYNNTLNLNPMLFYLNNNKYNEILYYTEKC